MATKIGDLVVNVDGDINKLRAEMRAAVGVVNSTVNDIQARTVALKSGFDSVLNPIRNVTGMLGPLAAGFGAVMSINAFGNMISQSVEAAARLHDLSMQTGVSVEALSGLASVGKLSDVSLDMIAGSANKMSKNLSSATEEGKGAAAALRAMNIDFESFRNLSPDQQMLTVANAMENFADGGGKTAAAMALMGKEGAAMIPFLKDLAAQGEINAKVTSEQAAMADNYGDNLVKIRGQSEAWKKHLAMSFLPVMDEVTSAYLEATSSNAGFGASIKRNASDGTFTNWARNAVIALTYLVDVGHGLLSVFDLIGTAIGGAMAATSTIFSSIYDAYNKMKSGDLRGAWEEIKSGARQTSTIAKETGKDIAAIWNQELLGEKIRKGMDAAQAARKQIAAEDAKPQIAMSAFAAPEKAAAAEVKANDEKRKAYDSLIKSINEKIAVQEQEQQGSQALTEAQKLSAKVMVDLRDGVLTLDETDAAHLGTLLEKLLAEEKSNLTKKEMIKLGAELIKSGNDQVKSLDAQIEAALRSNEELGMSKEQIDALSRSRMDLAAASDEELASNMRLAANYAGDLKDAYLDYADSLDEAAKKKRMLIQIKADGAEKQAVVEETKRQLQSIEEESKRFYDDIYRGLSDSLYRGFESGKGFGKSFMDGIKNLFKTTVLKIAVQGVMTGVLGMGVNGYANAQSMPSTSAGVLQSMASGKSLWDSFSAAAGAAGMAGNIGAGIAGVGNLIGSSSLSAFGTGMGLSGATAANAAGAYSAAGMAGTGSAISAGSSVAAAMPYVAAAMAAFQVSKAINGEYRIGGLSADMGALLGFAPRLFGMADKKFTGQTVTGNLGTNELSRNVSWTQSGGLFRSDRSGTWSYNLANSTAIQDGKSYQDSASTGSDQAMLKGLNAGYDALKKASADFAKSLGLSADIVASRTDAMSFKIGATQADTDKAISEMFAGIGDSIARALLPSISELSKEGEGASATLARVASNVGGVNAILSNFGLELFKLNESNYKTALSFVDAVGGLENLQAKMGFVSENFISDAERMEQLASQVNQEMAAAGYANVKTEQQFLALVRSLDLTSVAGQKTFSVLMDVAPAFKAVATAGSAILTDLSKTGSELVNSRGAVRNALSSVSASVSELAAKSLTAGDRLKSVQASISQEYFQAQDAVVAAQKRMADLTAQSAERLGEFSGSLTDFLQSLKTSSLGSATSASSYRALREQLSEVGAKAYGGDTAAQASLISVASNFLKSAKDNSRASIDFSRDESFVKSLLQSIADKSKLAAKELQATPLNTAVTLTPIEAATQDLTKAVESLARITSVAQSSGATMTRDVDSSVQTYLRLMQDYGQAQADATRTQSDYAMAVDLTKNLQLNSADSMRGLMGSLMELSTANLALGTAQKAYDESLKQAVTSVGLSSMSAADLAAKLGLSGQAAIDFATKMTNSGIAAALNSGGIAADVLAAKLGLSGQAAIDFGRAISSASVGSDLSALSGGMQSGESAARALAASLGLSGQAASAFVQAFAASTLSGSLNQSDVAAGQLARSLLAGSLAMSVLTQGLGLSGNSAQDFVARLAQVVGSEQISAAFLSSTEGARELAAKLGLTGTSLDQFVHLTAGSVSSSGLSAALLTGVNASLQLSKTLGITDAAANLFTSNLLASVSNSGLTGALLGNRDAAALLASQMGLTAQQAAMFADQLATPKLNTALEAGVMSIDAFSKSLRDLNLTKSDFDALIKTTAGGAIESLIGLISGSIKPRDASSQSLNERLVRDWYATTEGAIKSPDTEGVAYWVDSIGKVGVSETKKAFQYAVQTYSPPPVRVEPAPSVGQVQGNSELLEALRNIRKSVDELKVSAEKTESNTGQSARTLTNATRGTDKFYMESV